MSNQITEVVGSLSDEQAVIDPQEIARRLRQGALENEVTAATIVYGDLSPEENEQP